MDSQSLADLVLFFHLSYASFVVIGFTILIPGLPLGWKIAQNFKFRLAHMGAICFVGIEALLGLMCPLTIFENELRGLSNEQRPSFIAELMSSILYYDLPPWVFSSIYLSLSALALGSFWLFPKAKKPLN